jgi:hypothetical protein
VVVAGTGFEVQVAVGIAEGEAAQLEERGHSTRISAVVSRAVGGVEGDDALVCSSHWASRYWHQGMCDAASAGLLLPAALSCPSSCNVGG